MPETTSVRKSALRTQYLRMRRGLPRDRVVAWSAAITGKLLLLTRFSGASAVLSYVASKDNEVETRPLIDMLLKRGATVLVPVARPAGVLVWSRLASLDELAPSRFGILEPVPGTLRETTPPSGSVCLVPGAAFSTGGYRIGYGGGYYDRFLACYDGLSIGLAFDCQVADDLPRGDHDVPVDRVLTERRVCRCDSD